MIKNTMPPQAYTRDTLVKAIDWISSQPDHLRAQAKTAESLVALYLQAKRRPNDWNTDSNPVSGETFKEDLKSLARDLEQFTGAQVSAPQPQQVAPPTGYSYPSASSSYSPPQHTQMSKPTVETPQPPASTFAAPPAMQWTVDEISFKRAQTLKERLNLSSESEALRMMIALGFEKLQALLP